jgi:hypothetical protein
MLARFYNAGEHYERMSPSPLVTYPSGTQLFSSLLSPEALASLMQPLVMQLLGIVINPENPDAAYRQVKVGWQQMGQPFSQIDEDVCTITCRAIDHPFARVRDRILGINDDVSLSQQMAFTRVWDVHFILYGPNSFRNASLIVTGMSLDWVQQYLANPPQSVSTLYLVAEAGQGLYGQPIYTPEPFERQWWQRTDLHLKFNELVNELTTVPSAASAEITITTDTGLTDTVNVEV